MTITQLLVQAAKTCPDVCGLILAQDMWEQLVGEMEGDVTDPLLRLRVPVPGRKDPIPLIRDPALRPGTIDIVQTPAVFPVGL